MEIPLEYQVMIGTAIGGLIITLFKFIQDYRRQSKDESQRLAIISIIFGLLIIIPFASVIGLILGIISVRTKQNKALSKVAIVINCITILPWIAILIWGP